MSLKSTTRKLTFQDFLYLSGFLLISSEIILKFFGKSICQTEGCRIVESFVVGGEKVLLIAGLILFAVLFLISISKKFHIFHSTILIAALSAEGYLLAFQSFVIKEFCIFCLTVFVILLLASIVRLLHGRKEIAFAFVSLISVFFISLIVNPQIREIPSSQYVLVYSKDCPHCKEVIQYCKQLSIPVHLLEARDMGGALKSLRINSVPVLLCNEGQEKKFIIGVDKIKEYLIAKANTRQQQGSSEVCPLFAPSECK